MNNISTVLLFFFINFLNSYSQSYPPEWTARFNSGKGAFDYATNIATDTSGNIYVSGKSWNGETNYDYLTIKYNPAGVFQWESRYDGPGNYIDEPTGIAVDKSGNVYVTGFSYGGSSDYDYATVKYNANGIQQWVDRYNGSADSTDKAKSIAIDVSGNIYVTGHGLKFTPGPIWDNDCVTIKYNSAGSRIWIRSYLLPENSDEFGKLVKLDFSGNVIVAGLLGAEDNGFDLIIKY